MIGLFQQSSTITNSITKHLPTPKIAVARVKDVGLWNSLDSYSWRNTTIGNVASTTYTDDFYKMEFDVYVDSIGDNDWLSLPNVRLELLKVTNNNQGGWSISNTKNTMANSNATFTNSQKDYNRTIIVKSEAIQPNSWTFPDLNTGNVTTNKLSTPSLRVEVDLRSYFSKNGNAWNSTDLFPLQASGGDYLKARGLGVSRARTGINLKDYYLRNSVLYFRLVSTDGSKKIYSDLSIPIYLQPQVRKFYNSPGDINSGSDSIIYTYKIGLGNKV